MAGFAACVVEIERVAALAASDPAASADMLVPDADIMERGIASVRDECRNNLVRYIDDVDTLPYYPGSRRRLEMFLKRATADYEPNFSDFCVERVEILLVWLMRYHTLEKFRHVGCLCCDAYVIPNKWTGLVFSDTTWSIPGRPINIKKLTNFEREELALGILNPFTCVCESVTRRDKNNPLPGGVKNLVFVFSKLFSKTTNYGVTHETAAHIVAFVREALRCEDMTADEVVPYLHEIGVLVDHDKYCGLRRCDGTTR